MKTVALGLFVLVALTHNVLASITNGTCYQVPANKDFTPAAYLGAWYEIERFNYIFEDFLKCVIATYGAGNATAVTVYNRGYNLITGQESEARGYAYIPDLSAPNRLLVKLPIKFENQTIFENTAPYAVIDTDYKTYSLVYSCTQILTEKYEIVWILSRQKTLDKNIVVNLKTKLESLGISTKPLVVVDQSCTN